MREAVRKAAKSQEFKEIDKMQRQAPGENNQIEILGRIVQCYTNKQIAKKLFLSVKTILAHRKNEHANLRIKDHALATEYTIHQMSNLAALERVP